MIEHHEEEFVDMSDEDKETENSGKDICKGAQWDTVAATETS